MKMQIKHHTTGATLYDGEADSLKLLVEMAVDSDADLCGANLCGANLCGANLSDANLSDANLRGANLSDANLRGADLYGAYLCGAYLCGANIDGAIVNDRGHNEYLFRLSADERDAVVALRGAIVDAVVAMRAPAPEGE